MGLVHHLAARCQGGTSTDLERREDLTQTGVIGLIQAIDRFDPNRGFRFATYAVPLILGEMRRYQRSQQPWRLPADLLALAHRIDEAGKQLAAEMGREPSVGTLAAFLQVEVAQVIEALAARRPPVSLDAVRAGGADRSLAEASIAARDTDAHAAAPDPMAAATRRLFAAELLARLPGRSRQLLHLRYWDGRTQQETAAVLGLSQGQVSRLERQALTALRRHAAPWPF